MYVCMYVLYLEFALERRHGKERAVRLTFGDCVCIHPLAIHPLVIHPLRAPCSPFSLVRMAIGAWWATEKKGVVLPLSCFPLVRLCMRACIDLLRRIVVTSRDHLSRSSLFFFALARPPARPQSSGYMRLFSLIRSLTHLVAFDLLVVSTSPC